MTIQEILAEGKKTLSAPCPSACIDTPALDASLLLAETLQVRREDLIARPNDEVNGLDCEKYQAFLEKRRSGESIAYILGRKEFRGLEFAVNPKVLVPRPDTETLFEATLEYIDKFCHGKTCRNSTAGNDDRVLSVLDLCTGSGALAVSLKKERPFLSVTASDISAEALETAALNAGRLLTGEAAESEICFVHSDVFENLRGRFDIIVSNPPYIPSGEIPNLSPEVQLEPRLALDGGEDGLALIRLIVAQAPDHLLPGGVLLLEADPGQMPRIGELLANNGFTCVRLHKDLAGRERVITARLTGT
jgi:release factor glutamine methyltransferase